MVLNSTDATGYIGLTGWQKKPNPRCLASEIGNRFTVPTVPIVGAYATRVE